MDSPPCDPIPDDVRRLVLDHIESVPALEALLLMRKTPERRWHVNALAGALYMKPEAIRPIVLGLVAHGFCGDDGAPEPLYFWRPATSDIDAVVAHLADIYGRYLIPVTNLIHSRPRPSIRGFSDAFRLRGQP